MGPGPSAARPRRGRHKAPRLGAWGSGVAAPRLAPEPQNLNYADVSGLKV